MTYKHDDWANRMMSRSDLCAQVTHFTRAASIGGAKLSSVDVLIKILRERKIVGSNTESGFIVGNRRAVCFQEAPPYSLMQNIVYEEQLRKKMKSDRQRYSMMGIMFPKPYIFRKGGRPVIYDLTSDAKDYLKKKEWWRIINFSLSNVKAYIDWTHEREWRVPDDLDFDISKATTVVGTPQQFRQFEERSTVNGEDVSKKVRAILPIGSIFV